MGNSLRNSAPSNNTRCENTAINVLIVGRFAEDREVLYLNTTTLFEDTEGRNYNLASFFPFFGPRPQTPGSVR